MYAIYAYIDPQNHSNVGIYGSPMECLGTILELQSYFPSSYDWTLLAPETTVRLEP